jgi:hypothetical protein
MGADDWAVVASLIGSSYHFIVVCLGKVEPQIFLAIMRLTQAPAVKVAKFSTHMYNLSILHMRTRYVAVVSWLRFHKSARN